MSKHGEIPERDMREDAKRRNGEEMTREEMEKHIEEIDRRCRLEFAHYFDPIVDKAAGEIKRTQDTIKLSIDATVAVDARDSNYNENSSRDEHFESDSEEGGLHRAEAAGKEIKENEIGLVDRTVRFFARAKGITLFFGIATAIGIVGTFATSIAALVKSMNDGPSKPEPEPDELNLTKEQRDNLKTLIQHWWDLSDALLWDQLATFCDQFNPSLQAQVV
jgi:hypothetical protein